MPQHNSIVNLIDLDDEYTPSYESLLPGAAVHHTNSFSNFAFGRPASSTRTTYHTPGPSPRGTYPNPEHEIVDSASERQALANSRSEIGMAVGRDDRRRNTGQLSSSHEDASVTAVSRFDSYRLAALQLQAQFEHEARDISNSQSQADCARKLEQEERRRGLDFSADIKVAKRLGREWETQEASEQTIQSLRNGWEQENRMLEDQAKFAEAIRMKNEVFLSDQAAAIAAQSQWEQDEKEA